MRFLMTHKLEHIAPPTQEMMEQMGALIGEMTEKGVLLAADGVHPTAKGARLKFEGGKRTITDGPYAETKELIAGFALIRTDSKEEAIEWATRFANLIGNVEIDIHQLSEPEDFGEEFTPELREAEEQWRAKAAENASRG